MPICIYLSIYLLECSLELLYNVPHNGIRLWRMGLAICEDVIDI